MARGWESKGVESQIEALEDRKGRAALASANAVARIQHTQRDSLMLSRTRILADLSVACNPRYRAMLEQALAHLDEKLKEFGSATA